MTLGRYLLDLIFPQFCVGCKKEGIAACNDCLNSIHKTDAQKCPFCETDTPAGITCEKHKNSALTGCFSFGYYHDPVLRETLHKFKYNFNEKIGAALAEKLAVHVLAHHTIFPQDAVIVPAPLTPRRLRERGFNQSFIFAKRISEILSFALADNVLVRVKNTLPQARLSGNARIKNMANVFAIRNPEQIKNKNIILVDDVLTTGATLESAATTLASSGAENVYGIVLARG